MPFRFLARRCSRETRRALPNPKRTRLDRVQLPRSEPCWSDNPGNRSASAKLDRINIERVITGSRPRPIATPIRMLLSLLCAKRRRMKKHRKSRLREKPDRQSSDWGAHCHQTNNMKCYLRILARRSCRRTADSVEEHPCRHRHGGETNERQQHQDGRETHKARNRAV